MALSIPIPPSSLFWLIQSLFYWNCSWWGHPGPPNNSYPWIQPWISQSSVYLASQSYLVLLTSSSSLAIIHWCLWFHSWFYYYFHHSFIASLEAHRLPAVMTKRFSRASSFSDIFLGLCPPHSASVTGASPDFSSELLDWHSHLSVSKTSQLSMFSSSAFLLYLVLLQVERIETSLSCQIPCVYVLHF